jgi:hypothetical protein
MPLLLMALAEALFILAALNVPSTRVNLGWAGVALAGAYWYFFVHGASAHG